jgi:hypothetical protein
VRLDALVLLAEPRIEGGTGYRELSTALLPAIAGFRDPITISDYPRLHRARHQSQVDLAHLMHLFMRLRIKRSAVPMLGRSLPPRRRSPELSPVTISQQRRHYRVTTSR